MQFVWPRVIGASGRPDNQLAFDALIAAGFIAGNRAKLIARQPEVVIGDTPLKVDFFTHDDISAREFWSSLTQPLDASRDLLQDVNGAARQRLERRPHKNGHVVPTGDAWHQRENNS